MDSLKPQLAKADQIGNSEKRVEEYKAIIETVFKSKNTAQAKGLVDYSKSAKS